MATGGAAAAARVAAAAAAAAALVLLLCGGAAVVPVSADVEWIDRTAVSGAWGGGAAHAAVATTDNFVWHFGGCDQPNFHGDNVTACLADIHRFDPATLTWAAMGDGSWAPFPVSNNIFGVHDHVIAVTDSSSSDDFVLYAIGGRCAAESAPFSLIIDGADSNGRARMIVYKGTYNSAFGTITWSTVSSGTATDRPYWPTTRFGHDMVQRSSDGLYVMFGGLSPTSVVPTADRADPCHTGSAFNRLYDNDIRTLDVSLIDGSPETAWNVITQFVAPHYGRYYHTGAFDADNNLWMHGGLTDASCTGLQAVGEYLSYNGATTQVVAPDFAGNPNAWRFDSAVAFSAGQNAFAMFGGADAGLALNNFVVKLTSNAAGTTLTAEPQAVVSPSTPAARLGHTMSRIPGAGNEDLLLMVGGGTVTTPYLYNETWILCMNPAGGCLSASTTGVATTGVATTGAPAATTGVPASTTGTTTAVPSSTGTTDVPTTGAASSTTTVLTTTTTTADGNSNPDSAADTSGEGGGISDGVLIAVGIIVGVLCLACIIVVGIFVFRRTSKKDDDDDHAYPMTPAGGGNVALGSQSGSGGAQSPAGGQYSTATFPSSPTSQDTDYAVMNSGPTSPVSGGATPSGGGAAAVIARAQRQPTGAEWDIPFAEIQMGEELGRGAFGIVYAAKWRGAPCAVKVLVGNLDSAQLNEFEAEAALMKKLRPHANVVQFMGVCVGRELAIVAEFCEGGSMYTVLHDPAVGLDPNTQMAYIRGIASGMLHLHLEGVVHRDLAARNVLLTRDGTPKITDFGMSRVLEDGDGATSGATTSNAVGPLKWMAVESLVHHIYSNKTDVYAFGVTMFEVIMRSDPYPDMAPAQVATLIGAGQVYLPDCMSEIARSIFDPVIPVMERCLLREPEQRPDFQTLVTELDQVNPVT